MVKVSEISEKQIDDVLEYEVSRKYEEFRELAKEFLIWKLEYGIHGFHENDQERENWDKFSSMDEHLVWTLLEMDLLEVQSGFVNGGDRVQGWFIAAKPCDVLGTIVPLQTDIDCPVCESSGEVDGVDCEECDSQGNLVFEVVY
jgi:hypothetical protein